MLLFIILGLLFLLIFIIFILRKLKNQKIVKVIVKRWSSWAKRSKKIPLWQHASGVFLGLCFSILIYSVLISFFTPHFSNPSTTAVNWYTVHNYPMQQDKFYFVTAFGFIFIITFLFWFLWVLQKNKI